MTTYNNEEYDKEQVTPQPMPVPQESEEDRGDRLLNEITEGYSEPRLEVGDLGEITNVTPEDLEAEEVEEDDFSDIVELDEKGKDFIFGTGKKPKPKSRRRLPPPKYYSPPGGFGETR